jgi:hypothetical protein
VVAVEVSGDHSHSVMTELAACWGASSDGGVGQRTKEGIAHAALHSQGGLR